MAEKYLYGARSQDPRYLDTFQNTYASIGESILDDLKERFYDVSLKNNLQKNIK